MLVVVNATAGIIVIVAGSGQVGSTEAHVLETTGLLSLAALLMLPCALAYEAARPTAFPLLPAIAAGCLFAGFGLAVYLVWTDPNGDTAAKVAGTFGVAGGGLAHVCLLSLARMRAHAWLQLLAASLTFAVAAMIISAVWTVPVEGGWDDWKVRAFAVVAILAAATSLLVPLVDRLAQAGDRQIVAQQRLRFCPACGAALPIDAAGCSVCGARFRVEFLGEPGDQGDVGEVHPDVADAAPSRHAGSS
jgi:hypothetical protein